MGVAKIEQMAGSAVRILLADDHALFRAGLRRILTDLVDAPIVHEASSMAEVFRLLSDDPETELLLLDLSMPGMVGAKMIADLVEQSPNLLVTVISGSESRSDVTEAISSGAVGYIPKTSSPSVMINALRLILSGGVYLPPILLEQRPKAPEAAITVNRAVNDFDLTPRQRSILGLLVQGKSNKEIARELQLSLSSVKFHIAAVFEALGVSNRTEATHIAMLHGLTRTADPGGLHTI